MKRELGIARCGLACCLCSENVNCAGCNSGECPDKEWCENRKCSSDKNISHCFACTEDCKKGLLEKIKPYGFTRFMKRYGEEGLLDCLEKNEKNGIGNRQQKSWDIPMRKSRVPLEYACAVPYLWSVRTLRTPTIFL